MTQRARIYRALERGPIGPVDFLAPACDGGTPILRVAPRIEELRQAGHTILTERAENGTARYRLVDNAPSDGRRTTETRPDRGGPIDPVDEPAAADLGGHGGGSLLARGAEASAPYASEQSPNRGRPNTPRAADNTPAADSLSPVSSGQLFDTFDIDIPPVGRSHWKENG